MVSIERMHPQLHQVRAKNDIVYVPVVNASSPPSCPSLPSSSPSPSYSPLPLSSLPSPFLWSPPPPLPPTIFFRSPTSDVTPHEHILLRAEISIVKDAKKPHAFRLACKGVREVFFAADNEEELTEWVTKLQNASKRSEWFFFYLSHF